MVSVLPTPTLHAAEHEVNRRAVTVGFILIGLLVASCGSGDSAQQAALARLYGDPIFSEQPAGVGEVVREGFPKSCGSSGQRLAGTREYRLVGEPQTVIDGYEQLALDAGWRIVESRSVDPNEPFEGRRAQLMLERTSGEFMETASVDVGLGPGGSTLEASVAGGLEGDSSCS